MKTKFELIFKSLQKQGLTKELSEISLSDVEMFIQENEIEITNEDGEVMSISELFAEYEASKKEESVVEEVVEEVVTEEIKEEVVEETVQKSFTPVITKTKIKSNPIGVKQMSELNPRKKAYNLAAQNQVKLEKTGQLPLFPDADRAEYVAASIRLTAMHGKDYAQRLNDEAILKSVGTTVNSTYAAPLTVETVAPEILDSLPLYGAVRNLVSVVDMPTGQLEFVRGTADPVFFNTAEGAGITAGTLAYNRVTPTFIDAKGFLLLSNQLLEDSAFDVAEEVSKRFMRGLSKFEDTEYFSAINSAMEAGSFYNAGGTSATGWSAADSDDISDWLSLIPNRAWQDGTVKIACSSQFYNKVFRRIAAGSNGTNSVQLLRGLDGSAVGRIYEFDGIPIIVTDVLPSTWGAGQYAAYAGSFELGTKFGVVRGSAKLASSSDYAFNLDSVAMRLVERFALSTHDVGVTNKSNMVIGFRNS